MSDLNTLLTGAAPWAMSATDIDAVIAQFQEIGSIEALMSKLPTKADSGQRLANEKGVGVLFVVGPLFKSETIITRALGFTTYEMLMRDFQAALDDPAIKSIVLYVDSPGGEASGCDELATAIFSARSRKPIRAFVSGVACSGGYWIASAAEKITVSESAIVGSIGVALAVTDRSKADAKRGVVRRDFVSSNAPGKRPNLESEAGRAVLQKMVDDLGAVFIKHIARHRGVSFETVANGFGQGGVEVGANAVKAGMADAVGSFDGVLAGLRGMAKPAAPVKPRATSIPAAPKVQVAASQPPQPAKPTADDIAKTWKSVIDHTVNGGVAGVFADRKKGIWR